MLERAIDAEIKALIDNDTWKMVPLPPTASLLGSKWVFSLKLKWYY